VSALFKVKYSNTYFVKFTVMRKVGQVNHTCQKFTNMYKTITH